MKILRHTFVIGNLLIVLTANTARAEASGSETRAPEPLMFNSTDSAQPAPAPWPWLDLTIKTLSGGARSFCKKTGDCDFKCSIPTGNGNTFDFTALCHPTGWCTVCSGTDCTSVDVDPELCRA